MKNYILFVFAFALTNCDVKTTVKTAAPVSEEKTKEVLEHHWKTFQANDLEGTMADYTEESVLITPEKTYVGLQEIRDNFIAAFEAFPKDSSTLQLDKSIVHDDIGYIIWQATTPRFKLQYGTDTFVIRDGKIVRQTYAGVAGPL